MTQKTWIWASGLSAFLISLVFYVLTMAPTMLHIDCGELATVQVLPGIAHATGYPLFTILGYLFTKIPLFDRPITQLNFLAALWTASGIGLCAGWFFYLLAHTSAFQWKKPKAEVKENNQLMLFLVSVAGALVLAFHRTTWAQATAVEVYSLHILMLAICLWTITLAWISQRFVWWIMAAIALGFAFSNHLTTILAVPIFGWFYFAQNRFSKPTFMRLAILVGITTVVVAGFYSYLPLRAAQNPLLNWGNIHSWQTFKWHITGGQFQVWMFSSAKVAGKNLGNFLKSLPADWGLLALPFLFFGIRYCRKHAPVLLWGLGIGTLVNIFYAINYDIKDLEPYFLLAIICMGALTAMGIRQVLDMLGENSLPKAMLSLAIPLVVGAYNFSFSNQKNTTFFEDYTQSLMKEAPENSLIISQQWDFFITPYYYLRFVENQFPGTVVVDKELLRRSWYFRQVNIFDSTILKGSQQEVSEFLELLKPFENKEPYNANALQAAYTKVISTIIAHNVETRPVFLTQELLGDLEQGDVQLPAGYTIAPTGWLIQVVPNSASYIPAKLPQLNIKFPKNWKGYYSDFIVTNWNQACSLRSNYESRFGKTAEAQIWANAANSIKKVR